MNVITGVKSKLTLASIAMLASMAAQAVPITNPLITTGPSTIYLENTPGSGVVAASNDQTKLATVLSGVGNVELGKYGNVTPTNLDGTRTTLSGNFGTPDTVTLSSLVKTDWTDNSNALAIAYITGAASSIGATLDQTQLDKAIAAFFSPLATLGGLVSTWQLVSDPNISDVDLVGGHVVVGLDGFLDGSTFLTTMFSAFLTDQQKQDIIDKKATASEVVKVEYLGNTKYLYGFSATPTNYSSADGTGSYSGRFTLTTVPEPVTLALLGLGFAGLSFIRSRSSS